MKLAVVAANGKSGRLIVKEAVARGLDVTAVVRGENKTEALHTLKKDIMDLTKKIWQVLMSSSISFRHLGSE